MSDYINGIDTFKELYSDYFQSVWGFCNTYLKDKEQAMDATQETFSNCTNAWMIPTPNEMQLLSFISRQKISAWTS